MENTTQQPSSGQNPASSPADSAPPSTPDANASSSPPSNPTIPLSPNDPPLHKKNFLLPIIGILIVLLGVSFLAFWYIQKDTKATTVQHSKPSDVITPQKIVVGTDPTYPPMEFIENGVLTGYDVDLANFIGKELGQQVEMKDIVFDDLFVALEKKEIDMIISTVTVTEERKQKYDFSEPYLLGGQVILTQKINNTITKTADLRGKKIAVQKGTTIETEAIKYTNDELVIRYPDFVEATKALVSGEVDAIFADLPGAKGITNDNPTLKIASDPFTDEQYAIVFRKNEPKIAEINKALSALAVKGILIDLKQKWLDE